MHSSSNYIVSSGSFYDGYISSILNQSEQSTAINLPLYHVELRRFADLATHFIRLDLCLEPGYKLLSIAKISHEICSYNEDWKGARDAAENIVKHCETIILSPKKEAIILHDAYSKLQIVYSKLKEPMLAERAYQFAHEWQEKYKKVISSQTESKTVSSTPVPPPKDLVSDSEQKSTDDAKDSTSVPRSLSRSFATASKSFSQDEFQSSILQQKNNTLRLEITNNIKSLAADIILSDEVTARIVNFLYIAETALYQQNYAETITNSLAALHECNDFPLRLAHLYLGVAYLFIEDDKNALKNALKSGTILAENYSNTVGNVIRGLGYLRQTRTELARKELMIGIRAQNNPIDDNNPYIAKLLNPHIFWSYAQCEKHADKLLSTISRSGTIELILNGHKNIQAGLKTKLSSSREAQEHFSKAQQVFSKAIRIESIKESKVWDGSSFPNVSSQVYFDYGLAYFYMRSYPQALENFDIAIWIGCQQLLVAQNIFAATKLELVLTRYRFSKALAYLAIHKFSEGDIEKDLSVDLLRSVREQVSNCTNRTALDVPKLMESKIRQPILANDMSLLYCNIERMLIPNTIALLSAEDFSELTTAFELIFSTRKLMLTAQKEMLAIPAEIKITSQKKLTKAAPIIVESTPAVANIVEPKTLVPSLPAEEKKRIRIEVENETPISNKPNKKKSVSRVKPKPNAQKRKNERRKNSSTSKPTSLPKTPPQPILESKLADMHTSSENTPLPIENLEKSSTSLLSVTLDSSKGESKSVIKETKEPAAYRRDSLVPPSKYFLSALKHYPQFKVLNGIDKLTTKIDLYYHKDVYSFTARCLSRLVDSGALFSFAVGGLVCCKLLGIDPRSINKDNHKEIDIDLVTEANETQLLSVLTPEAIINMFPPDSCMVTPLKQSKHMPDLYSLSVTFPAQNFIYKMQIKLSEFFKKNANNLYLYQDLLYEDAMNRDFAHNAIYWDKDGNIIMPLMETIIAVLDRTLMVIDKKSLAGNNADARSFTQDFKRTLRAIIQSKMKGFRLFPHTMEAIALTLQRLSTVLESEVKSAEQTLAQNNIARTINIFMQEKLLSKIDAPGIFYHLVEAGVIPQFYKSFSLDTYNNYRALVNEILVNNYYLSDFYACLILLEERNLSTLTGLTGHKRLDKENILELIRGSIGQNKLYQVAFEDFNKINRLMLNVSDPLTRLVPLFYKHIYGIRAKVMAISAEYQKVTTPPPSRYNGGASRLYRGEPAEGKVHTIPYAATAHFYSLWMPPLPDHHSGASSSSSSTAPTVMSNTSNK